MIYIENGDKKFAEKVIKGVLKEFKIKKSDISVSVFFVEPEEIRTLNASARGVDRVTDVLSFQQLENVLPFDKRNFRDYDKDVDGGVILGEIYVCTERAKEQAAEYGHSTEREMGFLICHGMLHLLGFDHADERGEEEMNGISERILTKLKLKRE